MDTTLVRETIVEAKRNKWKICIYGTGILGSNFGLELVSLLELELNYVTDKNDISLKQFKCSDEKKITTNELLGISESCLVIVCVGEKYHEEILNDLVKNGYLKCVFLADVIKLDSVLEKYFDITFAKKCSRKVAIYTCITGEYDVPVEPLALNNQCDYYLISDVQRNDTCYGYIDVDAVVPKELNTPKDKNRYCKMHGYSIFPQYDYSIYVDGNLQIIKDVSECIKDIGYCGLAMLKHGHYVSIYEEAIKMIANGKSDPTMTKELIVKYANEGMPRDFGMFLGGLIVSEHKNQLGNTLLEQWFSEYMKHRLRDLYSLTYVLWKMKLPLNTIGTIYGGIDGLKDDYVKKICIHRTQQGMTFA